MKKIVFRWEEKNFIINFLQVAGRQANLIIFLSFFQNENFLNEFQFFFLLSV